MAVSGPESGTQQNFWGARTPFTMQRPRTTTMPSACACAAKAERGWRTRLCLHAGHGASTLTVWVTPRTVLSRRPLKLQGEHVD